MGCLSLGRHLGPEPADCPFSTSGFRVFIFIHSRQSLLPHRHRGTEPGKSHSNNRSTYLCNSVCQVISAKTRKRDILYPFLSIESLKSVVHFVYPMHFCSDILPLKSSRAARLMASLLYWAVRARPCAKTSSSNPDSMCPRSKSELSKVAEECVELCGQGSLVS